MKNTAMEYKASTRRAPPIVIGIPVIAPHLSPIVFKVATVVCCAYARIKSISLRSWLIVVKVANRLCSYNNEYVYIQTYSYLSPFGADCITVKNLVFLEH